MDFKLFAIDKIEIVLMPENMPVSGVCYLTDSGTGKCTRDMKSIAKNIRNDTSTTIKGF